MTEMPDNKKQQILAETGQDDNEKLMHTLELLDSYKITPPSGQDTAKLIALLKPVLKEQIPLLPVDKSQPLPEFCGRLNMLQLVQPQAMLLSKWFMAMCTIILMSGLALTNAVDGNTLLFLANASPVLGILTVLYEFRAKHSGVSELEAACPYSPAQLATARLIVVLGFDILLCLLATPAVSYWQERVLWQVITSWLGPLLLMLGIALAASLRLGIAGGCLVSAVAWIVQLATAKGASLFSILLPGQPVYFSDILGMVSGAVLILYSYKRWNISSQFTEDAFRDW
ncbi:hypothetical protein [Sporomusa malonica]|uniref:Uncharacterized protein n=1 Tax=Sporomusa malonica TaxID=112901 RepID=A0A1W2F1W7_9FIRM|nr:hypothetical protein [Sporomusa malonica]SMD15822.1 hypothetical protein SAMN04488500_13910 [Sporomusa malonica]